MTNRLADATSPYLQQHADNPVAWWPWCPEALEEARRSDRPILLSIGYSACHWCHVMAYESFEDPDTAALMNRLFVNIKVDREERPDLDRIYQNAHHLLTGRPGGWPLTVFLDPHDLAPFYAGTYFPPRPRHGMPGFKEVLEGVAQAWESRRDAIADQSQALRQAMERLEAGGAPARGSLDQVPLDNGLRRLAGQLDPRHGGFGGAPKFPHPESLRLLMLGGHADQVFFTLERMARGGLFDQLGGGFARYSVDERWEIPHFEKMLYDNGQLLGLYAEAWRLSGRPLFRQVCEATAGWLLDEMRRPEGAFSASLDADSEGEEGRYYLWTPKEVRALLPAEDYELFAAAYGLNRPANFEGRWHLRLAVTPAELAKRKGLPEAEVAQRLADARKILLTARRRRVPPGRDDKLLTGWNALAITGLARAGRLLGRPDWIAAAEAAADFIHDALWQDGRLLAVHKDGVSHLPACLDDHAWLLEALLELLRCRWRSQDLAWAEALAELMLDHFQDPERGGFYLTADDHEPLFQRPRIFTDDATPSGNGVAARSLLWLARLSGEIRYGEAAEATLRAAWAGLLEIPHAHPSLLMALQEFLDPGDLVILRGAAEQLPDWRQAAETPFDPRRLVVAIEKDADDLPPALADHQPPAEGGRAWLCRGTRCLPPVDDPAALGELLAGVSARTGLRRH